ncbi:adenylate/guanylate cyclase domain-containing protein [Bradyrhizobium sp. INPA01-394B]|uniref:adenylate/guanylate cyclase domain-containing protein n=1 Tax=Bradyrhizobium campsiandrae TaxID=1729892 RepID=UPI00165F7C91|nr:adenylate/guanylate cyclase domain-containing protein [Bradyrhizobium campsiandrae]MBC9877027.1 adenylate/guanylate cyclase domain-containing protein [Bradyrhizobium campsiandrae]
MRRIGRRNIVATVLMALVAGAAFASPPLQRLHGLSLDLLTTLRWNSIGDRRDVATSPVVVVAIDGETYDTPPFKGSPTQTWTREIGRVLGGIADGGAKVIGFDVIFPSSIEQSEIPFGDASFGSRVKGFDRDYLIALKKLSDTGKLVLGEILSNDHPERPDRAQQLAVRNNIRALNVHSGADNVLRRMPLRVSIEGQPRPAVAVELAARSLSTRPETGPAGVTNLSGYAIPSAVTNTLTLNFRGMGRDIPAYSFADLRACLEKGDTDFFRRAFGGKIVLLGSILNFDDRKLTSMHLTGGYDGVPAARCALPAPASTARAARGTVAGVFVHATAVRNLIEHDAVTEPGSLLRLVLAILFAAISAGAACGLAPTGAAITWFALTVAYTAVAVGTFAHAIALPLTEPVLAGLTALAMMIGYRFVIADREERFLRKSFAFYLAPEVIDGMVASGKMPVLGGEMRDITMFFSDLSGFSSIAEKMTPAELVALMNEYLSAMTDIIESHGGYVDKYIGDSIVAMFGAPADDPDHATHAVAAALQCRARLEERNGSHPAFHGRGLAHRIGRNSGEAVVGNIGSRRRFNYTVMSDTVNLASRLEGANKYFGTVIMVSEATVNRSRGAYTWRELDLVRVQGRDEPIRVYEPLAEKNRETQEQGMRAAAYAGGLACWRARVFAKAPALSESAAADDPPCRYFARRARALAANPPPADWTPVNMLEGK